MALNEEIVLQRMRSLLGQILAPEVDPREAIEAYYRFLLESDEEIGEEIGQYLWDLMIDLDDFEPNPKTRRECRQYYGDEKLTEVVHEALRRIDSFMTPPEE